MSWGAWSPAPLVLAGGAIASWRFAYGFARLRRRGRLDHAGRNRALLFCGGLAAAVLPLVSPLDDQADRLLSAHMLQHVLIGDVAPALLVLSVRGPLLAFVLPAPLGRLIARLERLPAWGALAAWAGVLAVWHVPALYDAALAHAPLHDLEHASLVAIGLLVWTQLIDPARRRRLSASQRLAFAGCLFLLGQLLSTVLFLAGPLYPAYGRAADQQLAGLVMMVEQTVVLGVFAGFLLRDVARRAVAMPTRGGADFAGAPAASV